MTENDNEINENHDNGIDNENNNENDNKNDNEKDNENDNENDNDSGGNHPNDNSNNKYNERCMHDGKDNKNDNENDKDSDNNNDSGNKEGNAYSRECDTRHQQRSTVSNYWQRRTAVFAYTLQQWHKQQHLAPPSGYIPTPSRLCRTALAPPLPFY